MALDTRANGQVAFIVAVVTFVAGFVSTFTFIPPGGADWGMINRMLFAFAQSLVALLAWAVGAFVATLIASALLGGKTTFGAMLRLTGLASVFNLLGVHPLLGIVGWVLLIIASTVGLDRVIAFGVRRAIATAVIAGALRFIIVDRLAGIILAVLIIVAALLTQ